MMNLYRRSFSPVLTYNNEFVHTDHYLYIYPSLKFFILVMILRLTVFMRQRFIGDYAVIDIYNSINIIVTFAILFILMVKVHEVVLVINNIGLSIKCFILYYLFCAIVGLLSPSPEYAIYRVFEFLACFIAIIMIVIKYKTFFKAEMLVIVWVSLILLIEFIGHIKSHGWNNFHTNRYSITASILFGYSFGELFLAIGRRKQMLIIISVISFCLVVLGSSTGTNIALATGIAVIFMMSPKHRKYILIFVPFIIIIFGINSILELVFAGKTTEDVVNLQHRFDIWESSWNLFVKNPFIGYGLNVATREYSLLLSSHNSYIEILLAGGIVGASILFLGIIILLHNLIRCIRRNSYGSLGCCTAVIVFFVNGISAPTIGYILTPSVIAFTFILALFSCHIRDRNNISDSHDMNSAKWMQMSQLNFYGKT